MMMGFRDVFKVICFAVSEYTYMKFRRLVFAKERRQKRRDLEKLITYYPVICDYRWVDALEGCRRRFKFCADGTVIDMLNESHRFQISAAQTGKLICLLKDNGIAYMESLSDPYTFDGYCCFIGFYDRQRERIAETGGDNPMDLDFLYVMGYIEKLLEEDPHPERALHYDEYDDYPDYDDSGEHFWDYY